MRKAVKKEASSQEEMKRNRYRNGEVEVERRKGRGDDQSLVHVASNEGGDTNRGELTSARAARQVAIEAEQS